MLKGKHPTHGDEVARLYVHDILQVMPKKTIHGSLPLIVRMTVQRRPSSRLIATRPAC
jgi:hypothetical protein